MRCFLASLVVLFALALSPALAEKRIALVIGNDHYPNLQTSNQLERAIGDARAMRDALSGLGFDVVYGENVALGQAKQLFFDFSGRLSAGDIAFVFYAGHGVALTGSNYLLPSDIPAIHQPETEIAIKEEEDRLAEFAIPEAFIIQRIKAKGARIGVVVLDACRDNPLRIEENMNPFRSVRPGDLVFGSSRGLARAPLIPEGIFSIYSANFGQRAIDRLGVDDTSPNSPFTRVFLKHLTTPGKGLRSVMVDTREEVVKLARLIGADQRPALYDEVIGGDLFLAGGPVEGSGQADETTGSVAADFELASAIGSKDAWDVFLAKHGSRQDDFHVQLARAALKKLALAVQTGLDASSVSGTGNEEVERVGLVRALQRELKRHRCSLGPVDGKWGPSSREGASAFIRLASLSVEPEPTAELLKEITIRSEPLCPTRTAPAAKRPAKKLPGPKSASQTDDRAPVTRASATNCRIESREECRQRVCPGGGCGLRGSGICSGSRRKKICN